MKEVPLELDAARHVMEEALQAAEEAGQAGEVPVGAIVVADGRIVARRGNEREASGDPTAHAEILALRDASKVLETWRLSGAVMVVTLEPCAMCAGALVAARMGGLVYGAADTKAGAVGSLYNLASDPRLNHELAWVGGERAAECAALLSTFFADRRSR